MNYEPESMQRIRDAISDAEYQRLIRCEVKETGRYVSVLFVLLALFAVIVTLPAGGPSRLLLMTAALMLTIAGIGLLIYHLYQSREAETVYRIRRLERDLKEDEARYPIILDEASYACLNRDIMEGNRRMKAVRRLDAVKEGRLIFPRDLHVTDPVLPDMTPGEIYRAIDLRLADVRRKARRRRHTKKYRR